MSEMSFPCYINPLTDFGFAKIFFNELNKDLLIDFLNEIIPEQDRIIDLQYQPTIHHGELEGGRKAIFDIFCTNEKGEFFIVEIQRAKQPYFRDRSLYYASRPIQNQAPKGKWNFYLKAVYFVGILDFILFDEDENDLAHYLEHVQLVRQRTGTIFSRKLNFIFVELPKFAKKESELISNTDQWLFCLRNLSILDSRPVAVQGRIFEKLFKAAEIKQLTIQEMEAYKKSVMEYDDVRSAVEYAREEGIEYGVKQGREEGIREGIKEGLEEGKRAGIEAIAKNCLEQGLPIEKISQLTGLSEQRLIELKKDFD